MPTLRRLLICVPSVQCAGRERIGGGVLARSSELAEGGRPGSRPAVTFNLDLVSIGVSSPASTVEFVRIPHRGMTPSHLYIYIYIRVRNNRK